ncbi:unnamed protein product [Phytophthora fragariaefolia]|uniref:Unnamed protein product n=1 Tax=Phytophthora fragariaefolia TaxID=1490495 RepID=A0A9W7CTT0_9STRA|nr:unnamed protein product [Phytophthora fragariaefolia]
MAVVILKHFDTWDKHAVDFGLKSWETFRNYPYALYATDVKFQPAYRPSGQFAEQNTYFSEKHKLYGYKLECSVAYPGIAVDLSSREPGSKSDVTLFLERKDVHMEMLQKNVKELEIENNGEGAAQHPIQWGVLVDKGYQGAEGIIRTIQPKRKPRGSELSRQDVARNRLVSSDRVLVENVFGRACMLWKAMYVTYKWSEVRYNMIDRICFALTNYHVSYMPLRNDDNVRYRSVLARYEYMADEAKQKRARSQKAYRLRRDDVLQHQLGRHPRDGTVSHRNVLLLTDAQHTMRRKPSCHKRFSFASNFMKIITFLLLISSQPEHFFYFFTMGILTKLSFSGLENIYYMFRVAPNEQSLKSLKLPFL